MYGETYAQAIEATGYEEQSLRNAKFVAASVEFSRRRENLSWSHHAEVASFDADEQTRWLDEAERKDDLTALSSQPMVSRKARATNGRHNQSHLHAVLPAGSGRAYRACLH